MKRRPWRALSVSAQLTRDPLLPESTWMRSSGSPMPELPFTPPIHCNPFTPLPKNVTPLVKPSSCTPVPLTFAAPLSSKLGLSNKLPL